jgi:two-component system response regulator (stage 0 sporulation protein F)/two-component system alkaline phosphatase synthesis response regulator PhoP/two-component system KDP operon response regulator KdpE
MSARQDDRRKIVVVDDAPEILDLLDVVLGDEGFHVVSCDDADQAQEVIAAEGPALVIVDLTMAGVHTWGLIETLVDDPRTRAMPFIICSGAVPELRAAEERVRSLGGDVLVKPFDLDLLIEKVHGLIAGD